MRIDGFDDEIGMFWLSNFSHFSAKAKVYKIKIWSVYLKICEYISANHSVWKLTNKSIISKKYSILESNSNFLRRENSNLLDKQQILFLPKESKWVFYGISNTLQSANGSIAKYHYDYALGKVKS